MVGDIERGNTCPQWRCAGCATQANPTRLANLTRSTERIAGTCTKDGAAGARISIQRDIGIFATDHARLLPTVRACLSIAADDAGEELTCGEISSVVGLGPDPTHTATGRSTSAGLRITPIGPGQFQSGAGIGRIEVLARIKGGNPIRTLERSTTY